MDHCKYLLSYNTIILAWFPFLVKFHTHLDKIKAINKWRDKYQSYSKRRFIISMNLHMENHFIPFQCVVHMQIMVFALWNHRGVRIVSFSAFPYWRRIGRTWTTKIRQILHIQHFSSVIKCLSEFCKITAHATQEDFFWGMILQSQQKNTEKMAQILITTPLYFGKWTQSQSQKKLGSRTIFSSTCMPPDQDISVNREVHEVLHC